MKGRRVEGGKKDKGGKKRKGGEGEGKELSGGDGWKGGERREDMCRPLLPTITIEAFNDVIRFRLRFLLHKNKTKTNTCKISLLLPSRDGEFTFYIIRFQLFSVYS